MIGGNLVRALRLNNAARTAARPVPQIFMTRSLLRVMTRGNTLSCYYFFFSFSSPQTIISPPTSSSSSGATLLGHSLPSVSLARAFSSFYSFIFRFFAWWRAARSFLVTQAKFNFMLNITEPFELHLSWRFERYACSKFFQLFSPSLATSVINEVGSA